MGFFSLLLLYPSLFLKRISEPANPPAARALLSSVFCLPSSVSLLLLRLFSVLFLPRRQSGFDLSASCAFKYG